MPVKAASWPNVLGSIKDASQSVGELAKGIGELYKTGTFVLDDVSLRLLNERIGSIQKKMSDINDRKERIAEDFNRFINGDANLSWASLQLSCAAVANYVTALQADVNARVVPNFPFTLANQLVTALGRQARAYQLVSETPAPSNDGDKRFARESAKNLKQLMDSVVYLENVLGAMISKTPIPPLPSAVPKTTYDLKRGPAKSVPRGGKVLFDDSAPQSYVTVDDLKGRDGQPVGCHVEFGEDVVVVDPAYSSPPGFTLNIGEMKSIRLYRDDGIDRTFLDGYIYILDVGNEVCRIGTSENLRFR
jgi:hypothetical protein